MATSPWPAAAGTLALSGLVWAGVLQATIGMPAIAACIVALTGTTTWRGRSLRAAADRSAVAMAISGDGVWVYDLRTATIRYDDRCAQMLGYERGHVADRLSAWGKLAHPDDLAPAREALDRFIAGESDVYDVTVRLRDVRGCWRRIRDRGRIVQRGDDGRPTVLVGIHRLLDDGTGEHLAVSTSTAGTDRALRGMSRWLQQELHTELEGMLRHARGDRRREAGPPASACARAVELSRRLQRVDAVERLAEDAIPLPRRLEDAIARYKDRVSDASVDARVASDLPPVAMDPAVVDEALALVLDELATQDGAEIVVRTASGERSVLVSLRALEGDVSDASPRLRAASTLLALQQGTLKVRDDAVELALPAAIVAKAPSCSSGSHPRLSATITRP